MALLPTAEDVRRWHPAAAFDLPSHRPYFSDDAWGGCMASHIYGLPTAVHAHVRVTPEGLLLHADCERCSERDELVLDFRELLPAESALDSVAVELPLFGYERARWLQLALWEEPLREWAERHRTCEPARPRPLLGAVAARTLGQLCDVAAGQLRDEGCTSPVVVAAVDGRHPLWFDADGATEGERMLTGFRVREATARAALAQAGAGTLTVLSAEEVLVGEGVTALRVTVLTGGANWVGFAPIDRFDRPAPGRGLLRPLVWARMRGSCGWADGLRARRRPFPVPRVLEPVDS